MKVYIGPYYRNWNFSSVLNRIYDFIFVVIAYEVHWGMREKIKQNINKYTFGIFETIFNGIDNYLINRNVRKIKIHIDGYDTWNLDNTLSLIAVPLLKKFTKYTSGAFVDKKDVPREVRKYIYKTYGKNKYNFKLWEWIVEEMIWAHEQIIDEESDRVFFKGNSFDKEGFMKFNKRIDNGLILFGKYYRNLWN